MHTLYLEKSLHLNLPSHLSHQPCFTGLLNKPMAQDSWLNLYWAWPSSTPACFEFYYAYAVSLNKSQDIVFYYSWWLPSNMSLIQWCSTEVQGRNSEKKARSHQFQQYLQYQEMGLSNKQTISRQFLGKPYLQDMIFNVCLCVCLSVYACVCVCQQYRPIMVQDLYVFRISKELHYALSYGNEMLFPIGMYDLVLTPFL